MRNLLDNIHYYLGGILTGVVFGGFIYAISKGSGVLSWVYAHETLSAALIAFVAAFVTVLALHKQIRQAEELEGCRRKAKLEAERAVLVLTLSFILDHCESVFKQSIRMAKGEEFTPTLPDLPQQHIDTLKACVEYAAGPEKSKLVELICELQLIKARFRNSIDSYQAEHHLSQAEIDDRAASDHSLQSTALGYMLAAELLPWARNKHAGLDVNWLDSPRSTRIFSILNHSWKDWEWFDSQEDWPNLKRTLLALTDD